MSPHNFKHSLIRCILLDLHARKVASRWCVSNTAHGALRLAVTGERRTASTKHVVAARMCGAAAKQSQVGSVGFTMLKQNFFVSCMPIPASALGFPSAPSTRTLGDLLHALKQSVLPTSTCSHSLRYLFAAATHRTAKSAMLSTMQSVCARRVSWTLKLTSTSAPLFPSSSPVL